MRRFYRELLRFVLLSLVLFMSFVSIKLLFPSSEDMSTYDLKRSLLLSKRDSSVVLLGGSNVSFGFDSRMMSDSLRRPVLNIGTGRSWGLKFILDFASVHLSAGDVLVLSPEYEHMFGDTAYGSKLESVYRHDASVRGYFSKEQYIKIVKAWIEEPNMRLQDIYRDNQFKYELVFNSYGDHVGHWDKAGVPIIVSSRPGYATINYDFLDYYASSVRSLRNRGVEVVILPPSFAQSSYEVISDRISAVRVELSMRDIDFHLPPEDFVYADSLFFDLYYHLGYAGVLDRTHRVIDYLRPLVHP